MGVLFNNEICATGVDGAQLVMKSIALMSRISAFFIFLLALYLKINEFESEALNNSEVCSRRSSIDERPFGCVIFLQKSLRLGAGRVFLFIILQQVTHHNRPTFTNFTGCNGFACAGEGACVRLITCVGNPAIEVKS